MHLLFVGDTAVGKSHIVHTLAEYGQIYEPKVTIGINYKVSNIFNKKYYLWDLPGSHRLFKVLMLYVKKTFQYNFIVCHVNNQESIKNIDFYINELRNINDNSKINYHILINTCSSELNNEENTTINRLRNTYMDKISVINSFDCKNVQSVLDDILTD